MLFSTSPKPGASGACCRRLPAVFDGAALLLWRDNGVWQTINHVLLMDVREEIGREASPTAGVIDSQSIKTTESGGRRGYAAEKMIKGRKRRVCP